jgi:hypothetical protein
MKVGAKAARVDAAAIGPELRDDAVIELSHRSPSDRRPDRRENLLHLFRTNDSV